MHQKSGTISAEEFAEGSWISGKKACIQGPEGPVWAFGPMGPKVPFRVPFLRRCSRRSRQLTGRKACLQGPEGPVWAHGPIQERLVLKNKYFLIKSRGEGGPPLITAGGGYAWTLDPAWARGLWHMRPMGWMGGIDIPPPYRLAIPTL